MKGLSTVVLYSLEVFILLMVLARLMGKKMLSQMTYYDFVVGIAMGAVGGGYILTASRGPSILMGPVVLTVMAMIMSYGNMKSWRFKKLIQGEPVIVIQNGRILENNMGKLRYTLDALQMQLRENGVFDIGEVEFALLEPHGQLSVLKKSQELPLTPRDLGIPTTYKGLPSEIVRDGDVIEQNLQQNSLDFGWLYRELHSKGVDDIRSITLALLRTDGTLYLDMKDKDLRGYVQEIEDKVDPERPLH